MCCVCACACWLAARSVASMTHVLRLATDEDERLPSAELPAAQEVQELMQERDEATAQVTQVGQLLSKVRAEQKAIVDARNKHEKKCGPIPYVDC